MNHKPDHEAKNFTFMISENANMHEQGKLDRIYQAPWEPLDSSGTRFRLELFINCIWNKSDLSITPTLQGMSVHSLGARRKKNTELLMAIHRFSMHFRSHASFKSLGQSFIATFSYPFYSPLSRANFHPVISHRTEPTAPLFLLRNLIESLKYRLPLKLQTKWGLQPFLSGPELEHERASWLPA